jgi:hypothetical protein
MALFGPGSATTVIATAATQVYTVSSAGTAQNPTVINQGANTFAVGTSSVTYATGLLVAPGNQVTLTGTEIAIYAICNTGKGSLALTGLATVDSVV